MSPLNADNKEQEARARSHKTAVKANADQAKAKERWLRKMFPVRRAKTEAIMANNLRQQDKRVDHAAAKLAKALQENKQAH